jgi:hypothetical protein
MMKFVRFIAKVLLTVLLLLDVDLIWHLWRYGRPHVLKMKEVSPGGDISISSTPIPMTIRDWAALAVLLAVHGVLICFLLRSRRKSKSAAMDGSGIVA